MKGDGLKSPNNKQPHEAVSEIAGVLDRPPEIVGEPLRDSVRVTRQWGHGALHDTLAGLNEHVVMTYYGVDRDITWRTDGKRNVSRTRIGSITLIPEGHDGRWDIGGSIEVSHVYIPDHRLQAAAQQLSVGGKVELLGRVGFDDLSAARLLELLSREAPRNDPASRLFLDQAIDLLCFQLVRAHSTVGALTLGEARGGLANWQVKRVTQYMQEHLGEEIGLDELSRIVNLGRFHFCTAFRKATGQTPHNWLMTLRMHEARRLLGIPELAVTDVALAVGYQTPSSFAAAFRKVLGMTPRDYRRRMR